MHTKRNDVLKRILAEVEQAILAAAAELAPAGGLRDLDRVADELTADVAAFLDDGHGSRCAHQYSALYVDEWLGDLEQPAIRIMGRDGRELAA